MVDDESAEVPKDSAQVLDLYKVAVDGADKVSARRGSANQYFITLETLILGVPTLFGTNAPTRVDATALSIVGIVVSLVWWLQLRSYRDLNTAKFNVINEIERKHFDVRPFSDEWNTLKTDRVPRWRDRYAELGTAERIVPIVFAVLHGFTIVRTWVA